MVERIVIGLFWAGMLALAIIGMGISVMAYNSDPRPMILIGLIGIWVTIFGMVLVTAVNIDPRWDDAVMFLGVASTIVLGLGIFVL